MNSQLGQNVKAARSVSAVATKPRPDITLFVDDDGVIEKASFSNNVPPQDGTTWVGKLWMDTVEDDSAEKARRLLDDASTHGVSGFRQVNQRLPSGAELLMEYTAVRVGEPSSLIVVGKSLQTVTRLQSRLIAAQQAMERDYWTLRQLETRYQRLFQSSNEAVLVVTHGELAILEANPAAMRALDPTGARRNSLVGCSLLNEVEGRDHETLRGMLARALDQGAAPAVIVRVGEPPKPWLVHGTPLSTDRGQGHLLQLLPTQPVTMPDPLDAAAFSVEALMDAAADAFVVADLDGIIHKANRAFLKMAQVDAAGAVVGKPLTKWLGRPGPDGTVLLANVLRHGVVRMFSTTVQGELGGEFDVEISAVVDNDSDPKFCGVIIRDVGRRLPLTDEESELMPIFKTFQQQIGKKPIRRLVQDTVSIVENQYIRSALKLTGGNRTAAAELLGLSRQSLYSKLGRYGLGSSANDISNSDA